MSNAATPISAPPVQPYDELLKHLGLSREDLRRLQNEDLTVMELMTEHLQPIAWAKEIERREYVTKQWEHHQQQVQEVKKKGTMPPTWYGEKDPFAELTELEALEQLAGEIDQGISAHNDLGISKAYDLGIKDELPEWMTWGLLESWSDLIRLEALANRRENTPTPPPFDE